MSTTRLYHLTSERQAVEASESGRYTPEAFSREGFIHCSYAHQLAPVANRLFRGRRDLVVFEIDPSAVGHRIVDENLEGGTELFPHIYGPLPMAAVLKIHPFPYDGSGAFHALNAEPS